MNSPSKDRQGQCLDSPPPKVQITVFATGHGSSPSSHYRQSESFSKSFMAEEDTPTIPPKREALAQHRKGGQNTEMQSMKSPTMYQMHEAKVDAANPTNQPATIEGHELNAPSDGQSSRKEVKIAIWGSSFAAAIIIILTTYLGSKDTIPNQDHAFLPLSVIFMSLSYISGVLILIHYIRGSRDMPKVSRILSLGCIGSATIGVLLWASSYFLSQ